MMNVARAFLDCLAGMTMTMSSSRYGTQSGFLVTADQMHIEFIVIVTAKRLCRHIIRVLQCFEGGC